MFPDADAPPSGYGLQATAQPGLGMVPYAGGLVRMVSNQQLAAEERAAAEHANARPVIQGLAGYVRRCWDAAREARREIDNRMLRSQRQRRGEYDPEVLTEIRKSGGSEIYMMLTSNKCRAASAWLRDALLGTRDEKPWTLDPTPLPDLPPDLAQTVISRAVQEALAAEQQTGAVTGPPQMAELVARIKDRVTIDARDKAREMIERMERRMEDQLVEGGFQRALSEVIDDIVTFPVAVLKGPVVRRKPRLSWVQGPGGGYELKIEEAMQLEWERVDPFKVYPAPHATSIDDGFFIERHELTLPTLEELIGVEGYSDGAIRAVLDEYGRGGLRNWLYADAIKVEAEGKIVTMRVDNPEPLIDALQFWGSVQGRILVEWGLDEAQVPDPLRSYHCEVWLVGRWVIRAMVNPDPLGRKPYYKASYESVPGTFWGNSVADLARDTQTQCNTAARALANNMAISSGPQVMYNIDRLPPGEDLTEMYPWKIWQANSDPYGSSAPPVVFFQPGSIAGELMAVFNFFSTLADEYTGMPRYMAGDAHGGGALRTASGVSMLISNAGKGIKQVVANIDAAIQQLIERLYFYNMRWSDDAGLKGDVNIIARGANNLVVKEQQQVRVNEFLQIALNSPVVGNIVGPEAIAELLRLGAKNLDMDTDRLVPRPEVLRARLLQEQQAALAAQAQAQAQAPAPPATMPRGGQQLASGARATNNFAPMRMA